MTSMADKIRRSSIAVPSDDATRESASEKEHSKSTPPTSYRFPPETLAQIEALRIAEAQQTGRVPTATDVIKTLVREAHQKVNK